MGCGGSRVAPTAAAVQLEGQREGEKVEPQPIKSAAPCIQDPAGEGLSAHNDANQCDEEHCDPHIGGALLGPEEVEVAFRRELNGHLVSWRESGYLAELADYAGTVEAQSLPQLVKKLTHKKAACISKLNGKPAAQLQLAKAYVAFCWIAKHISSIIDGTQPVDVDPIQHILATRSACTSGYSTLFHNLAKEMGLDTAIIRGYLKKREMSKVIQNGSYHPFTADKEKCGHSWNAVKLFNVWCLVDSCLGAGYTDKTFKECFELFYFATPPEQLVLTHIPNDDKWQLLQRPYSLEDHQYRIVPHPSYFKFGILAEQEKELMCVSDDSTTNVVQLKFKLPSDIDIGVKVISTESGENLNEDGHLVYFEQSSEEENITSSIVLPSVGLYSIEYYRELSTKELGDKPFVRYFVHNLKSPSSRNVGYPVIHSRSAHKTQFKLLHWSSTQPHIAENDTGECKLEFTCSESSVIGHSLVDESGQEMQNYYTTLHSTRHDGEQLVKYVLKIIYPEEGNWLIKLWSTVPGEEDLPLMDYRTHVSKIVIGQSYPLVHSDAILISHSQSVPVPQKGLLKIPFRTSKALTFRAYLVPYPNMLEAWLLYDYSNVSKEGLKRYQVNAVFPKKGKWKVGVELLQVNTSEQWVEAFSILASINNDSECDPHTIFPLVHPAASRFRVTIPQMPVRYSPDKLDNVVSFKFKTPANLIFNHHIMETSISSAPIKGHTFLTQPDKKDELCILKAVFPRPGLWAVQLFAEVDHKKAFQLILSLNVTILGEQSTVFKGFPEIIDPITAHKSKFRVLEWNKPKEEHVAESTRGKMDVVFCIQGNINIDHYIIKGNGDNSSIEDRLHYFTFIKSSSPSTATNGRHTLSVVFPEEGIWTVLLAQDSNGLSQPLLKYTINVKTAINSKRFPQLDTHFHSFGLQLLSTGLPFDSIITSLPSDLTVEVSCPKNISLILVAKCNGNEIENATTITQGAKLELNLLTTTINQTGVWEVKVFAKEQSSELRAQVMTLEVTAQ